MMKARNSFNPIWVDEGKNRTLHNIQKVKQRENNDEFLLHFWIQKKKFEWKSAILALHKSKPWEVFLVCIEMQFIVSH